jgi:hypothetical protein
MEDRYIWDMVALLQVLPRMSAEQYGQEVAASGGHSHGGTNPETDQQDTSTSSHEHSSDGHSHEPESSPPEPEEASTPMPETRVHTHKDGAQHVH